MIAIYLNPYSVGMELINFCHQKTAGLILLASQFQFLFLKSLQLILGSSKMGGGQFHLRYLTGELLLQTYHTETI